MKNKPKTKTLPDKVKSKPPAKANPGDHPGDALAAAFQDTPEMTEYLNFLDTLDNALERGEQKAMLPTAFLSRVRNQFQPMDYQHLREAWNRVCDELDIPRQKVPLPTPEPRGGEEGTF
jgi:hypothetical protein